MRGRAFLAVSLMLAGVALAQDQDDPWADEWEDAWDEDESAVVVTGFAELAAGGRVGGLGAAPRRATLADARLRAEAEWTGESLDVAAVADAWYDGVDSEPEFEMRELTVAFSPGARIDAKIGRQVLTWGTGDLLFLNDLFPKDFVSFFAGRDDEYLKAPSDTVKLGFYGEPVNVELAWTPRFQPDEYLTGERFAFFSPAAGVIVAPEPPIGAVEPSSYELALRIYRNLRGVEYAGYAYRGYFKQPTAVDADGRLSFAPLTAVGASVRLPLWSGLANAEFAWYDSRDDGRGDDPAVPNGQVRLLAGFEREAAANFTVGLQYYLEHTLDHEELVAASPNRAFEPEEWRHVLTNRLTWRLQQDRWTLSLFTFLSPSDEDFYLRPAVNFRQSDRWLFAAGGNWFGGREVYTFFGQLEDNSNLYFRVRYNY